MMDKTHIGSMTFIPRIERSVELRGCDWAPISAVMFGSAHVCRDSAGNVFIATKKSGAWLDCDGLERDPVDFILGLK